MAYMVRDDEREMEPGEYKRLLKLLDEAMSIKSHELTPEEHELLKRVHEQSVWEISEEEKARLTDLVAKKGHLT
jgi:hypothetical protein